jgi:hypothetical protein
MDATRKDAANGTTTGVLSLVTCQILAQFGLVQLPQRQLGDMFSSDFRNVVTPWSLVESYIK